MKWIVIALISLNLHPLFSWVFNLLEKESIMPVGGRPGSTVAWIKICHKSHFFTSQCRPRTCFWAKQVSCRFFKVMRRQCIQGYGALLQDLRSSFLKTLGKSSAQKVYNAVIHYIHESMPMFLNIALCMKKLPCDQH